MNSILFLLLVSLSGSFGTATNSLSDCQSLAANFDTTCGGVAAASISAMAAVNVTCTSGFTNSTCPGSYSGGTCLFGHKLCVTCSGSSPTRIRVQTNGLPRYCPNSPNQLLSTSIDFSVNFNPDVNINSPNHNPTTVSALTGIVCNISSQMTTPSGSNTVLNVGSTSMDTIAGVSVDGVSIENVNSANNVDPFYPPNITQTEYVDACLGHPNFQSVYHYHMASGCALTRPSGAIQSCSGVSACRSNASEYGITLFNSYRNLTVIGIARDGHVIYGPYYSSGVEVRTGFDICNGVFYDTIGNYAYFATRTFPYITGCFGPGNYPSFFPTCTTNPASTYTRLSLSNTTTTTATTTTTTTVTLTTSTSATTATTTSATTVSTTTTRSNTASQSMNNGKTIAFIQLFVGILSVGRKTL